MLNIEYWLRLQNLLLNLGPSHLWLILNIVGNKAKGPISKWEFEENRACQIFRKTDISYPLDTHTYVYVSGGKKHVFRKIWRALFSWNTRLEIGPVALLPTILTRRYVEAIKSI